MRKDQEEAVREGLPFAREAAGLGWLFLSVFTGLALATFDPRDPTFNQAVSAGWKVVNLMGQAGAYAAGFLIDFLGLGSFFLPLLFLLRAGSRFIRRLVLPWWRQTALFGLFLCCLAWADHPWLAQLQAGNAIRGGGFFGGLFFRNLQHVLEPAGSFLFLLFMTVLCLQLALSLSWSVLFVRLREALRDALAGRRERNERRERLREDEEGDEAQAAERPRPVLFVPEEAGAEEPIVPEHIRPPVPRAKKAAPAAGPKPAAATAATPTGSRELPSLDLLAPVPASEAGPDPKALKAQAEVLAACLADFNIQGEIQQVVPGPVVTMFEFKPAPGVKISRIASLSDDIALALKATAVRIEAPIPGKDTVGVEIPNERRQTVYLRDVFESEVFAKAESPLTLALGKDIQGHPAAADLARMPHLLVAGATGAGKSVCLNGILLSLLFKAGPDEVKLLLVDPKRIELSAYADLPHLVHPVVTEMHLAKNALDWAVHEMDTRYENMARLGVRNISGYNEKLAKLGPDRAPDQTDLSPMPYLVIVIDELADLMMTSGKDVEISIVRLAQLARAAGVHIILATQRPSVDVVTGLIKANFPTRISFQTTSKHDSRTILDTVGAERLLGRGDMLYKPAGGKLKRMHGAFVDEEEIAGVVEFWKSRVPQQFDIDFAQWGQEEGGDGPTGAEPGDLAGDELYRDAVEFVVSQGKASISLIQRRFRIGFNRAARFIEQMEADGLLGPQEGSRPRSVIPPKD